MLKEHKNIHTGNNPYICTYCGKGFKRYANYFIHVHRHKLVNGEVDQTEATKLYLQLKCDKCNRIFASRGALQNHLVLHSDSKGKNFLCTHCGKGLLFNYLEAFKVLLIRLFGRFQYKRTVGFTYENAHRLFTI